MAVNNATRPAAGVLPSGEPCMNCPICRSDLDYHTDVFCVAELQAELDQLRALVLSVLQQPFWREFVSRDGQFVEIAVKMSGEQARQLLQMSAPGLVRFPSRENGGNHKAEDREGGHAQTDS